LGGPLITEQTQKDKLLRSAKH